MAPERTAMPLLPPASEESLAWARSGRPSAFPISLHLAAGWALVLATLAMIGFWVPPAEQVLGESYLIFFFHFPSAINCLNLFFFAGIASVLHLWKKTPSSDFWAASAVEVGVLACTVTLVTGSIWARAAWNTWWSVSDPRLTTVAIMWLTYLGYLALRGAIDEPAKRGRFCAVFAAIATVNIFIVYYSIRVLGTERHPMNVVMDETSMVVTRWFGAGAFLVLYTAMWRMRYRVLRLEDEASRLDDALLRAGL